MISIGEYEVLHDNYGWVLEINDGRVVNAYIEEDADETETL